MEVWVPMIIALGLLVNIILSIREGKDERWQHITNRPLNYAFSLLFIGYTLTPIISKYYEYDLNEYKTYYDFLFAGVLVVYIVLLLLEKKRLS